LSHCRALSKKDPGARRAPAQYRTMAIPSPHSAGELAGLINSAEEFLWSVDSEFRLLSFNQALSKHIENHSGILLQQGMLPEEFFPAEAERWRSLYRRAIREGNYDIEQIAFGDTCYSIRLRRIELDGNLTYPLGEPLTRPHIEWDARPAPVIHEESRGGISVGPRVRVHVILLAEAR